MVKMIAQGFEQKIRQTGADKAAMGKGSMIVNQGYRFVCRDECCHNARPFRS